MHTIQVILFWIGLPVAGATLGAHLYMATGRPLVFPERLREVGSFVCKGFGGLYLGFTIGNLIDHELPTPLDFQPKLLAAFLYMVVLGGFFAADWLLWWVVREDEQVKRAGFRAQRVVLRQLYDLGVEPALNDTGYVNWRQTAEKLEAGLQARVFGGDESLRAQQLRERCQVLANTSALRSLRLRTVDARARNELAQMLQLITDHRVKKKAPEEAGRR